MTADLFSDVPASVRLKAPLALPPALSEPELLEELARLSEKDSPASSFLGGGSYHHFIPSALKHIVGRSEFYTSYTPYQAEASQGTLQTIYEYQSMICGLTGMDAANASMYDGATALAEAALMAARITSRKEIAVSTAVHPHYRQVLSTYCNAADLTITEVPYDQSSGLTDFRPSSIASRPSCYILQQPNFFGNIEEINGLADQVHAAGALFIVSVNPISLGLLKPPGEYGADIVVGEGQSLGNARNFGGPGLGIFAVKKDYLRQLPGRIVGATVDADGRRGFVLTMAAREQHIRREKATSNICTNEALCALAACVYLSLMGKTGLRKVAELCLQKTIYLKKKLGSRVRFADSFSFNELVVRTEKKVGLDLAPYYPELTGHRLIAVTELAKKESLDSLISVLSAD